MSANQNVSGMILENASGYIDGIDDPRESHIRHRLKDGLNDLRLRQPHMQGGRDMDLQLWFGAALGHETTQGDELTLLGIQPVARIHITEREFDDPPPQLGRYVLQRIDDGLASFPIDRF
ncbi:hypothetical protein AB656_00565 [Bifidobacterium actinocoloniiforme DSM 22766]|nr:hypothetical protein AB656_00565 [Bifidobacterium actinocoloniiforme DSM 22766]